MLYAFIMIPLLGGLTAWAVGRLGAVWVRLVALFSNLLLLGMTIATWVLLRPVESTAHQHGWWFLEQIEYMAELGLSIQLGLDGLSVLMLALTSVVGLFSVLVSWEEIEERVGIYHACLLWVISGVCGVFLSLNLIVFYVFWEVMLVPMVFLIGIWGHEKRVGAAYKFFVFTQAGSLFMLLAILGLGLIHYDATGSLTFNFLDLITTRLSFDQGMLIMIGFLIAFAVKIPVVPIHGWLADAHSQAPTAGSLILAGLLLKTGAYGIVRFVIPMFTEQVASIAPFAMMLGAVGILYGAMLAFSQTDIKRMIAYTSISHMGFVLLGLFAGNRLAQTGAVLQMVCHALSTGALFALAGMLSTRLHSREFGQMGGLWTQAPRMGAWAVFFAVASLGLPGMGNFIAEFLVLFGSFAANKVATVLAASGLILAAVIALKMIYQSFQGRSSEGNAAIKDIGFRETAMLIMMAVGILWLGLFPQTALDVANDLALTTGIDMRALGAGR